MNLELEGSVPQFGWPSFCLDPSESGPKYRRGRYIGDVARRPGTSRGLRISTLRPGQSGTCGTGQAGSNHTSKEHDDPCCGQMTEIRSTDVYYVKVDFLCLKCERGWGHGEREEEDHSLEGYLTSVLYLSSP